MGCLFGGVLREGGLNVTLVDVWQEHVDAINTNGLRLVGPGGSRAIPIRATTDAAGVSKADIVSVHCKAHNTVEAARSAAPFLGDTGVAVSFQNGIGNEEAIAGILGEERVLGGWTAQGASVEAPGIVRIYNEQPSQIGEMDGGLSDRAIAIAGAFSRAGLPAEASPDIVAGIWTKLMTNVALSAPSAFTNLPLSGVAAVPELRAVMHQAVDEAAAVARASGIQVDPRATRRMIDRLVGERGTGDNRSSVCVDVLNERQTEIDAINGAIVRLGREAGLATPVNETFCASVKALEARYMHRGGRS